MSFNDVFLQDKIAARDPVEEFMSESSSSSSSLWIFLKRVRNEQKKLENRAEEILSVTVVEENESSLQWEAKIKGPVDTPYENGIFVLDINITAPNESNNYRGYPFVSPKIKFQTKVFHPNINSNGEICLNILDDRQCESALMINKILLSICSLLAGPNTDDFIVPEAAFLYENNRQEYDRKAREWTRKYTMTDDTPYEENTNLSEINISSSGSSDQIIQQESVLIRVRSERFNVIEPLQAKTFDNGESKKCVPIIQQCFNDGNDRQMGDQIHMYDFHDTIEGMNLNNELRLFIMALKLEGITLGSKTESETLIDGFRALINERPDIVGQGCLRLYSMETFLYSQLNQFLRKADDTKIEIYGPFVRLLYSCFDRPSSIEVHSIEVYRGMNLSPAMIDSYKEATKSNISFRWTGFSSTSKSRQLAEHFNTNTLFIMKLRKIYLKEKKAIDISDYSQFPQEEEEVLLKAGVEFTVEKVNYDAEKTKHYIYLNIYV